MKLIAGKQYLDRDQDKWTIDYVGKDTATGHNAERAVGMWFLDGTTLVNYPSCNDLISEYTEPTFIPWETPQEVPAQAWFRRKDSPNNWVQIYQIRTKNESEDMVINPATLYPATQIDLLREFEHSIDNGVTWLPCGKEKK